MELAYVQMIKSLKRHRFKKIKLLIVVQLVVHMQKGLNETQKTLRYCLIKCKTHLYSM